MMTVRSIGSDGADGYADYLDGKTVRAERGDYYLGRDGEPIEAPGRWLASPQALAAVGITDASTVGRDELVALMQGINSTTGDVLRAAAKNGKRNAGVDVVFSAPKSVSIAWALGDAGAREVLEQAHTRAVAEAVEYLRGNVPVLDRWVPELDRAVAEHAWQLLAAEFRHSTARGLAGRLPDPQLHSHVVITSGMRGDGRVMAVRDRRFFIAAREVGAHYRAGLARELAAAGYEIERETGTKGRYFEIHGVGQEAIDAFSGRSKEITKLVRDFQAREGRAPDERELQLIKVDSRQHKLPHTEQELRQGWATEAAKHGLRGDVTARLTRRGRPLEDIDLAWGERVERTLTDERSTFTPAQLRAVALEQAAGRLGPDTAVRRAEQLQDAGRMIGLEGGLMTTRSLRAMEQATRDRAQVLAADPAPALSGRAVATARRQVAERLGGQLSAEQEHAVATLTGSGRIAALEGQAGTGKGVVIDAVARAELLAGREVIGAALAGATAERLGADSPALRGQTLTIAALISRYDSGELVLTDTMTVFVDEAGMVDTKTMHSLTAVIEEAGAKLIAVGDGRQLSAIGPGGMFDQLTQTAPKARLTEVRRTEDAEERRAWRALRTGRAERALAHYAARGQLHLADQRHQAVEQAVARYDELAREHGPAQVALMSDGSTEEIDQLNARAQHLRRHRGELGQAAVELPDEPDTPSYRLHEQDRVAWRAIHRPEGQPRVENGTRGTVLRADPAMGSVLVQIAGSGREVQVTAEHLDKLRLGYASSVYKQQGATVDRAVAVTGAWQTDREGAYVQASRARHGIDWHLSREDLGTDGTDLERVEELARRMSASNAKIASIAYEPARVRMPIVGPEAHLHELGHPGLEPSPLPVPVPALGDGIDR